MCKREQCLVQIKYQVHHLSYMYEVTESVWSICG